MPPWSAGGTSGDVNGVVPNFTEGVPGDTATATKEGNTYTVTGVASGVDPAGKQVSKPFQIVATRPRPTSRL